MVQTRRQTRKTLDSEVEKEFESVESVKPTPVSRAKALAGKLFNRKASASKQVAKTLEGATEVQDDETTPKHKSPKPDKHEMHPRLNGRHAKTNDEAPWLGFFSMPPRTDPPRPTDVEMTNYMPTSPSPKNDAQALGFGFTSGIKFSPNTVKSLQNAQEEAARIREQLFAEREKERAQSGRKIAIPKPPSGRFSDVHKEAFKKMDSISSHHSLHRSSSKKDLSNCTDTAFAQNQATQSKSIKSLKRSPSKAELDRPSNPSLKRTQSKTDLKSNISQLRRAPSKGDLTKLRSPEKTSSIPVPTDSLKDASPDRNIKRRKVMEVSPPKLVPTRNVPPSPKAKSMIGHTPSSGIYSPTRSSIARAQSIKSKAPRLVPGAVQSNSGFQPSNVSPLGLPTTFVPSAPKDVSPVSAQKIRSQAPSPMSSRIPRVPAQTIGALSPLKDIPDLSEASTIILDSNKQPKAIKSILRSPRMLFSSDPAKIAAGTHLATPPDLRFAKLPATAPVKRVVFSASTCEKADLDEVEAFGMSPILEPSYPDLSEHLASKLQDSPTSRLTCSAPQNKSTKSADFTFRVAAPKSFPANSPSIRKVRNSDAVDLVQPTHVLPTPLKPKRKVDDMEEGVEDADKENVGDSIGDRPIKRVRTVAPESRSKVSSKPPPSKKESSIKKSTLLGPRTARTPKRNNAKMSAERLAFLAQPKNRG